MDKSIVENQLHISRCFLILRNISLGYSLVGQRLRQLSNACGPGSIPSQGAKILHALWQKNENIKQAVL